MPRIDVYLSLRCQCQMFSIPIPAILCKELIQQALSWFDATLSAASIGAVQVFVLARQLHQSHSRRLESEATLPLYVYRRAMTVTTISDSQFEENEDAKSPSTEAAIMRRRVFVATPGEEDDSFRSIENIMT